MIYYSAKYTVPHHVAGGGKIFNHWTVHHVSFLLDNLFYYKQAHCHRSQSYINKDLGVVVTGNNMLLYTEAY